MKGESKELIAFNDLSKLIINQGFCTLCGACEAACPVHAITINERGLHHDDCSNFLDLCPICYDVCPHTEPLLIEAMKFVAEAPKQSEALGQYRRIVLAQAVDPKLREASHSGGVVTALLTYALDNNIIDSAVISEEKTTASLDLKPVVGLVPDNVLSAVDSEFFPSVVAKAFGSAVREYGRTKIGFVGVPHQVLALRKLQTWEHKITGSLELTIGLFCLWIFSLDRLLNFLSERFGIKSSEIERIDLTDKYSVQTTHGVVEIPISEIMPHVLNRCRTCTDFTAELADISIGGATPLTDWSTVIIRTKKGEDLFRGAVKQRIIRIQSIERIHDAFAHLITLAAHKRRIALKEAKIMERIGKSVPPAVSRISIELPHEISVLDGVLIQEVMTKNVVTVSPEITVSQMMDMMTKHHHMGYPVLNEKTELIGIVTFEDVAKVPKQKRKDTLIRKIIHVELITSHPEDPVLDAFKKMGEYEIGRILIVDRKNPKRLRGILTRTDIIHALRTRI